jgi:four helix bundle protein
MADLHRSPGTEGGRPYDIRKRTFQFGVRIVKLVGRFPRTIAATEIGRQLIKAGTSVGSNMHEADEGVSKKDFINHVRIARKEARESGYWLSMVSEAEIIKDPEVDALSREAEELLRILTKIINRSTRA